MNPFESIEASSDTSTFLPNQILYHVNVFSPRSKQMEDVNAKFKELYERPLTNTLGINQCLH